MADNAKNILFDDPTLLRAKSALARIYREIVVSDNSLLDPDGPSEDLQAIEICSTSRETRTRDVYLAAVTIKYFLLGIFT